MGSLHFPAERMRASLLHGGMMEAIAVLHCATKKRRCNPRMRAATGGPAHVQSLTEICHWNSYHDGKDPGPMQQAPPLTPPANVPFSVACSADGILIILHAEAGQHPALTQRQASQWIHGVALPVAVDFRSISLVNSRIVGWLFGLIHDGPLTVVDIRNANRAIHAQIRRIGLSAFIAAPPGTAVASALPVG